MTPPTEGVLPMDVIVYYTSYEGPILDIEDNRKLAMLDRKLKGHDSLFESYFEKR